MVRTLLIAILRLALAGTCLFLLLALWQLHADDSPANIFARPAMTVFIIVLLALSAGIYALVAALVRFVLPESPD